MTAGVFGIRVGDAIGGYAHCFDRAPRDQIVGVERKRDENAQNALAPAGQVGDVTESLVGEEFSYLLFHSEVVLHG